MSVFARKPPAPLASRIETLLLLKFAVTTSMQWSPFRSPTTKSVGVSAVAKSVRVALNAPPPIPSRTHTLLVERLRLRRSSMPSPFTSARVARTGSFAEA
jgi:hypothetical protein